MEVPIVMENNGLRYVTACPVGCAATLADSGIVLHEGPLRRCAECGQLVSSATEAQYLHSLGRFDHTAGTLPDARSQSRHDHNTARRLGKMAAVLGRAPATIRLLDVGCSSGAFLLTARRLGFQAEGVEPSETFADYAEKRTGFKIWRQPIEDANIRLRLGDKGIK